MAAKSKESVYITVTSEGVKEAAESMKAISGPLSDLSKNIASLLKSQTKFAKANAATKVDMSETNSLIKTASDNFTAFTQKTPALQGALSKVTGFLTGPAGLVAGFSAAGVAAYKLASDTSKAFEIQAKAERELVNNLANAGFDANIEKWREYTSQIQAATTVGDEAAMSIAAQAAQWATSEDAVKKATQAAIGWAAATGKDAKEATKTLGDAVTGNAEAIKKLGVYLTKDEQQRLESMKTKEKEAFILDKVNALYKDQAENLVNLPTGALQQISNLWGDVQEQVGEIAATPLTLIYQEVADLLKQGLDLFNAWVKENDVIKTVTSAIAAGFVAIKHTCLAVYNALKLVLGVNLKIRGIIIGFATDIFQYITKPITGVIDQITSIINKLPLVPQSIKDGLNSAKSAATGFLSSVTAGAKTLGETLEKDGNELIDSSLGYLGNITNEINKDVDRLSAKIEKISNTQQGRAPTSAPSGGGKRDYSKDKGSSSANVAKEAKAEAEIAIQTYQDYLNKRSAMMVSYETDLENYKKALAASGIESEKQQEEMLNSYKLQKQQELYNSLKQAGDSYRAQEQNAEIAAFSLVQDQKWQLEQDRLAKAEEAARLHREAELDFLNNSLSSSISTISSSMSDMFFQGVEGTLDMRQASYDMFKSLAKNIFSNSMAQIVQSMVGWATNAGQSASAIPVVGPVLGLAASTAILAMMGIMKAKAGKEAKIKYASGGYVSSGLVQGAYSSVDSVPALLQPGERVLSKAETKAYDNERFAPGNTVNVNVSIMGGFDKRTIQTEVREYLIPEIKRALGQGYNLNPA